MNWLKVVNENYDEVLEIMQEAYKNSLNKTNPAGYYLNVEVFPDGKADVWLGSQNQQTVSSFNGESICVASFTVEEYDYEYADGEIEFTMDDYRKQLEDYMDFYGNELVMEKLDNILEQMEHQNS